MKNYSYQNVDLTSGYLFEKQELNRKITINTVYDRFTESGRIGAFNFDWVEGNEQRPHFYWDSDVAKWMEGAVYILRKHPDPALEQKVEDLIAKIIKYQGEDGYFNIYFTVVAPKNRFVDRNNHELYCAGHLMEAAVAYAEATGREDFLRAMERYAEYIYRVFVKRERSVATPKFVTPGHQEIELALLRMYVYTKNPLHLKLAEFFLNTRGTVEEQWKHEYNQSHLPIRKQTEAEGHSVRALYMYTAMASLAKETEDRELFRVCKALFEDLTKRKMYITGGFGSTHLGEAFTAPYDLPSDGAYTETCASIAMTFFALRMMELETDSRYADMVERGIYNGCLSGLSLDGKRFFYENPLEINHSEHFQNNWGKRKLPITQRVELFVVSCCPPNLNRFLASLGNYFYGLDDTTLYVHQYGSSKLTDGEISCIQTADYPRSGDIALVASGVKTVALRIPGWCKSFALNKPYYTENGYIYVKNDGTEIRLSLDMTPTAVFADPRVIRTEGRIAVMRGPVVYCAEAIDNGENLHGLVVSPSARWKVVESEEFGLPVLESVGERKENYGDELYSTHPPVTRSVPVKLIPYNCFANRADTDMSVWLYSK